MDAGAEVGVRHGARQGLPRELGVKAWHYAGLENEIYFEVQA